VPCQHGKLGLSKVHDPGQKGTFEVQATTTRPPITVTAAGVGVGVVSHAGSRLLADLADRTSLTGQLSQALDGLLRAGNAGSNTAADHIVVLDAALAQLPDAYRYGTPVLVRADTAGCTKAFLRHVRSLRDHGVASGFSVGWAVDDAERTALTRVPERAWTPAIDATGQVRDVQETALVEITDLLALPPGYPAGIRIIVRWR